MTTYVPIRCARDAVVAMLTAARIPHVLGPDPAYPALPAGDVLTLPESREEYAVSFEFGPRGELVAVRGGQ